jgi:hypothetical protein
MKHKYIFIFLLLGISMASCITDYVVDEPLEPMLQVDATLFANEPIREIKIRKAYKATGAQPDTIYYNDLWADGASVLLFHVPRETGALQDAVYLELTETNPGRFLPVEPHLVQYDRTYHIQVSWENLSARAEATVPNYEKTELQLSHSFLKNVPDTTTFVSANVNPADTNAEDQVVVAYYELDVFANQTTDARFMSIQLSTESERVAIVAYSNYAQFVGNPLRFSSHILDEINNSFSHTQRVYAYFPVNSSAQDSTITLRAVVVVPEDIYADYTQVTSTYLLPATVTNVTGGVGLFMAARRDTIFATIPLN